MPAARNTKKGITKFVNRKKELKKLKEHMELVQGSQGALVFLRGEAGVGKTALAGHFAEVCHKNGFEVLKGRCLYFESIDPYVPFLEALKDYVTTGQQEDEPGKIPLLAPVKHTRAGGLAMGFIGLPAETDDDSVGISLSDRREMMFDKVTKAVTNLAEKNPVLLFIDDLQWIDGASAMLLHHLARHIQDSRVFILGAYRPEELSGDDEYPMETVLERMREEKLAREIEIERLSFKDTSIIIKDILHTDYLPQSFLLSVHRETEGNPYYIREILDSMLEEGIIDPYSYGWDPEAQLSDVIMPSSIKDVTTRRIERLRRDEKTVLMYASVMGTEFDFRVLEKAIDMDVDLLLDIIDELEDRGLIYEMPGAQGEMYRFNHVQTRLILYNSLGKSRKRVFHKLVGRAIETLFRDDPREHIFTLSNHFFLGQDYEKAYEYSIMAGKKSLRRYAIEDAIDYFKKARISLHRIDRDDTHEKNIDLLRRIGEMAYDISDFDTSRETYLELLKISRTVGDPRMEAEAHIMIGNVLVDSQNFQEALGRYEKALKISLEKDDKEGIARSRKGLGYILCREGMLAEAIKHYEVGVEAAEEARAESLLAKMYIDIGNVYSDMGDFDKTLEYYLKAIPSLKKHKSWGELARAYNNIGDVYMRKGEWEESIKNFDKTIEYAGKVGNKKAMVWGLFNKAEGLTNLGELEQADHFVKRAEALAGKLHDSVGMLAVFRTKGLISMARGDHTDALKFFHKSLELAQDVDIPWLRAEIKSHMGDLYVKMGDPREAMAYLEGAKKIFEEIGNHEYVKRVEEKLAEL